MLKVPNKIDYLSLDAEGAELFITKDFLFHEYQFSLLTIERIIDTLSVILKHNSYVIIHYFQLLDSLWAHQSLDYKGLIKKHELSPQN